MNYYISDLHFGHKNILRFDNRPYNTTEEMELDLISRWNKQVSNADHVYVLGDFLWKAGSDEWIRILNKLNGNIHLILGNHDPEHYSTQEQTLVEDFAQLAKSKNPATFNNLGQMINVGCMMPYMNYTPQTFEYLLMKYKKGETKA